MYVDGQQIPLTALQPSFGGNNTDYISTYRQMKSGVGLRFHGEDCLISYDAFRNGSTVVVFDLTADLSNAENSESTNHRRLLVEVRFSVQVPHAVTCFVHAEYYNCIEINQYRNILLDYLI